VSVDLELEIKRFGDELRNHPVAKPIRGEQENADWQLPPGYYIWFNQ
jgi:hypothetical protein